MTINCKGQLLDLSTPKVMGILNVTPDSFYDGGKFSGKSEILNQAERMLKDGTTFIDIGGYSSRPGADEISETEELQRTVPITTLILHHFPEAIISIDTFRSSVAKKNIEAGASLINDISAGHLDENMLKTVANLKVPYIMMHMRGNPKTMQNQTDYLDLTTDINRYFSERILQCQHLQIKDVIIDPGFGFSKTLQQNFQLLNQLSDLKICNKPILAGISRKSMIYKSLNITSSEALNGTTALNMIALDRGASILRVHDVKEAMECVRLYNQLKDNI